MVPIVELRFSKLPVEGQITGGFKATGGPYPVTGHKGADIGAPEGVAVMSWALTPTKVWALHTVDGQNRPLDGWGDGSLGNCVVLDHVGTPWYSFYAHLQGIGPIEVGMDVLPGTIIGWVGRTGFVTGAHLHWALCRNNGHFGDVDQNFADPMLFVGEPELPLEARLERLERIVAANGVIEYTNRTMPTLTGEEALKFADKQGLSVLLSAQQTRLSVQELATKVSELADEAWEDDNLRDDLITELIDLAERLREAQ